MDEDETVDHDKEQLDALEDDIDQGRQHLKEMTHEEEASLYDAEDAPAAPEAGDAETASDTQPPG